MSDNVPFQVNMNSNEKRPLPLIVAMQWNFILDSRSHDKGSMYNIQEWIKGISSNQNPSRVWSDLKRSNIIHDELYDSIVKFSVKGINNKTYQVEFGTDEVLYFIAAHLRVTSQSGKALEQIKEYLAKAGVLVDVLRRDSVARTKVAATGDPEALIGAAIDQYRKAGRDDRWIQARIEGVVTRKQFTSALSTAVRYASPYLFSTGTNKIYKGLWDRTTAQLRGDLNLKPKDNVRDGFGEFALIYTRLAEKVATTRLEGEDEYVSEKVAMEIIHEAARLIYKQAQETSQALGIDLVTERPLLQNRNE
ncbi:MAG: hypothetical protein ABI947_00535 [Chloroflexota bacterium]